MSSKIVSFLKDRLIFMLRWPFSKAYLKKVLMPFDEDWFKDKKVAIVGGADSVLKEKLGDYIDSFDVVVRINKGVEVIEEQHEYVGEKTDVLFHCLFEDITKGGSPLTFELWKKWDVKQIVFSHNFMYTHYAMSYMYNYYRKNKGRFKIAQLPVKLYRDNMNAIRPYGPTTGFVAINTILNCKPKELYITGITFFKTPHNQLYRTVEQEKLSKINKGFHDMELEYQCVKRLYSENRGVIKPDKVLEEIFSTN